MFLAFKIVYVMLILLKISITGCEEEEVQEGSVVRRIGGRCNSTHYCDSVNYFLDCLEEGFEGTCICNPKLAIQVDFLGYAIEKICLLKGPVACEQATLRGDGENPSPDGLRVVSIQEFERSARELLQKIKEPPISDGGKKDEIAEEIAAARADLRKKYGSDGEDAKWTSFLEGYFANYSRDVRAYFRGRSHDRSREYDVICASGDCRVSNKTCTAGVNAQHRASGRRRKFRNGAWQRFRKFPSAAIVILTLLIHPFL